MLNSDRYDVVVLGSGLSGSLLACVMARRGYRVVIIDGATHPKFAIGESTIPHTSQVFEQIGRTYDVPEIEWLGNGHETIRQKISPASGIKKTFGFCYHQAGAEYDPLRSNVYGNVWRDENHLYRQEVDAFLFQTAIKYGAVAMEGCRVAELDFNDERVSARLENGRRIEGRFIVDGTGWRSPVVESLNLRETPTRMKTRTRSIFTHMIDVAKFEDCAPSLHSVPWSCGTLHQIFDGGWFWVIPFNNFAGATNQTISVGLTMDIDVYPAPDGTSPEEEFWATVRRHPAIERQFADARAVRPWVHAPRLQYSVKRTTGARYCLMSNTAGFIDPLFSRGLISTAEVIHRLVAPLSGALDDNDFSDERFADIDAFQSRSFDFADRLVAGAYLSWRDYDVWNAWQRLWAIGVHGTESILGSHIRLGQLSRYKLLDNPLCSEYEPPGFKALFEQCWTIIESFGDRQQNAAPTATALWQALQAYSFEIALLDRNMQGHEWALTQPDCRDCFLGLPELHTRWVAKRPDPEFATNQAKLS